MTNDPRQPFTKPALSIAEQIEKLTQRGLVIAPGHQAEHYLKYIGYYRLTGYFRFFQTGPSHTFKDGTTFTDALNLYIFDRQLRLLVMDAIERIEVAARTVISNVMCEKYGPHWFTDRKHFRAGYDHAGLIVTMKADTGFEDMTTSPRRSPITNHYYSTYKSPELPPSWMLAEVLSLGTWSKIYSNLGSMDDQKRIAMRFQATPPVLESWLRGLNHVRNICAHHQLLWNRKLTIAPLTVYVGPAILSDTKCFYATAALIEKLMQLVSPRSAWAMRLFDLLTDYPAVPVDAMGFPQDWALKPFWSSPIQQAQQAKANASP